jgi:hypothetical protein
MPIKFESLETVLFVMYLLKIIRIQR